MDSCTIETISTMLTRRSGLMPSERFYYANRKTTMFDHMSSARHESLSAHCWSANVVFLARCGGESLTSKAAILSVTHGNVIICTIHHALPLSPRLCICHAMPPCFREEIFTDGHQTMKFVKVFSLECFPLYTIWLLSKAQCGNGLCLHKWSMLKLCPTMIGTKCTCAAMRGNKDKA